MLVRIFALIFFAFTSVCFAEEIIIGSKGGVSCDDPKDLEHMIASAATGKNITSSGSCRMLPKGTKIETIKYEKIGDGIIMGIGKIIGTINNKDVIIFTSFIEEIQNTSTTKSKQEKQLTRSFKLVSPTDVKNTPTKWMERDIEFTSINVYWVEDDDVRILTGTTLTLFAKKVIGSESDIKFLKNNCETANESSSRKCKAKVRFSYSEHSEDMPSGIRKRTVIISDDVELIRVNRQ